MMKSEIAKLLRKGFHETLSKRLPEFTVVNDATVPPGCRLYERRVCGCGSEYILLVISPTTDRFTLECAWSRSCSFPAFAPISSPVDVPAKGIRRDEPGGSTYRFRLASLWSQGKDYWWSLEPTPEAAYATQGAHNIPTDSGARTCGTINQCIDDAVARLEQFGIPFLQHVPKT
jgi:hypothetical protein